MLTSPKTALIVIGDEILNGRTRDINAHWLSTFLFVEAYDLKTVHFIKDHEESIKKTLDYVFNQEQCQLVITSGGLGPTIDDKTKNVLAQYFQMNIVEHQKAKEIVINNYERFGRSWTPELNHYHFFPEKMTALNNPVGLAPGLFWQNGQGQIIACAPGVPREFQEMVKLEIIPKANHLLKKSQLKNFQVVIKTQGIPEEKIFNELCPTLWQELEAFGKVSSLPQTIGIDIVVSLFCDEKKFEQVQIDIHKIIKQSPLEQYVWQLGDHSLPDLVFKRAQEHKLKMAFAESCTGGLIASKMTNISGASEVFWGSIVCYDNSIKKNVLGVTEKSLQSFGAVSEEVACEMAIGVLKLCQVDIAVAITGIAGPTGGSFEKPVGTVVIATAKKISHDKITTQVNRYQFPGDRMRLKERFAEKALHNLYSAMEK